MQECLDNNDILMQSVIAERFNSVLTEKTETSSKAPEFKVNDRLRITKYKNIFSKDYTENWSREIFIIDSVLKTNSWTYKIKDIRDKK